jgi:hypothetical protein
VFYFTNLKPSHFQLLEKIVAFSVNLTDSINKAALGVNVFSAYLRHYACLLSH